jgi:hypothetical protein
MSERASEPMTRDDPDLRTQRYDDQLLDQLGRGERIQPRDDVDAMLGAWRQELPTAGPPDPRLVAAVTTVQSRPKRKVSRASLSIAASVALLSGGVMVGAAYANPDSPLWPVTRLVYGNLAESRMAVSEADQALADARSAVARGDYREADRLLDAASRLAGQVDDPAEARRLRAAIDALRDRLADAPQGRTASAKPSGDTDPTTPPADPARPPEPTDGPAARPPDNGNHNGAGNGGPANGNGPANGGPANGGPANGNGDEATDDGDSGDGADDGERAPTGKRIAPTKPEHTGPAIAPAPAIQ